MSGRTQAERAVSSRPLDAGSTRLLQRQCACGTRASGGMCEDCRKKGYGLQRKLVVGSTDDPLECEADRVAEAVTRGATWSASGVVAPRVQRVAKPASAGLAEVPASVDRVLAAPGGPLPHALRDDIEQAFGQDFSHVRVHTGGPAEQSARDLGARAYTVGTSIVFGAGCFAPGDQRGRRLLAHELAHVVQQSGAPGRFPPRVQRDGTGPRGCSLEVCWAPIRAYHLGTAGLVHGVINLDAGAGLRHLEVDPSQHASGGAPHSHVVDSPGRRAGSACQVLTATCAEVAAVESAAHEYESRDAIYDPSTVTGPNSNSFVEWVLGRAGVATSRVTVPTGASGWDYYLSNPPQRTDPPHVARSDPGRTPAPAPRAFGGGACSTTYRRATTATAYIALVRAAVTELAAAGITSNSDQIEILRGLYYGTPWSRDFGKEQSMSRVAGFQVFTLSGPAYSRDPVSILDCGLYDALQRSQDITTRGVTVDVGHLLIGLDARGGTIAGRSVPSAPMIGFGGSGLDVVTWLGDLGGGAASLARDRARGSPATSVSAKFSGVDYGGPGNLEGDIAAYVVANGGAMSVVAPEIPAGTTLADALDAFLSPAVSGGSADWRTRARSFLAMFGGVFDRSGALSNEPAMIDRFAAQVEAFACAYATQRYVGTMPEIQLLATCDHIRSSSREVAETFVHALVDALPGSRIVATRYPSPTGPTPGACLLLAGPIRARRTAGNAARRAGELWERAGRAWEEL